MPILFNHQLGHRISPLQERGIKEAFLTLYTFVGAKKDDHCIFTSSGAEGANHAVLAAYLDITRKTGKNHFLCTCLDEAPAIMAMSRLQDVGSVFQMVEANQEGTISVQAVAERLTPRTAMLSMSWANGLTGVIQPAAEIAELCRERGVLFHIEASHVVGKGDFSFEESGADIITFNGGPEGTGALFFREHIEISPLILGGSEQGGMRGGSFSFASLVELARWAKEEEAHKDHYGMEIARLKSHFESLITSHIPSAKILFQQQRRVSHITSFLFPGVASDSLCYILAQKGVHATFGGGVLQHFSHVLKACGVSEPDCHSALSFGFSHSTSEEEINSAAQKIVEVVSQLQHGSKGIFDEL